MSRAIKVSVASLILTLTGAPASGCGHAFDLTRPRDFVEVAEDDSYAVRATNADGVVLAVREIDNDDYDGSLAFWSDAIEKQIRDGEGYELVRRADVRAASGEAGKELVFERELSGRPYLYRVVVFVDEAHVFVLEAGGGKASLELSEAAIDRAIASFSID